MRNRKEASMATTVLCGALHKTRNSLRQDKELAPDCKSVHPFLLKKGLLYLKKKVN